MYPLTKPAICPGIGANKTCNICNKISTTGEKIPKLSTNSFTLSGFLKKLYKGRLKYDTRSNKIKIAPNTIKNFFLLFAELNNL